MFKGKIPVIIVILLIAIVIIDLITLSWSPLPWYDEVVFADIAKNYIQTGRMQLTIMPSVLQGDIYIYGPLYFVLQKIVLLGKIPDIFSFRLLNLISSFVVIVQIYFIVRKYLPREKFLLISFLILSDAVYIANSHSGRMDLLVLVFSLLSFQAALHYMRSNSLTALISTGLFAAFTFLTSPRGLFLLTPVALLFIYQMIEKKGRSTLKEFIVLLIAFILPFVIYITVMVGGISKYLAAFSDPDRTSHLAISFWRESYEMPAIIMSMVLSIYYILKNTGNSSGVKKLITINLVTILIFVLLVKNIGPYTAMIIPFVYMNIILCISNLNVSGIIKYTLVSGFILLNVLIFGIKFSEVFLNRSLRDLKNPCYSDLSMIDHSRSKVFAPFAFYYYSIRNNINYESNELQKGSDEEFAKHIIDSNPGYIVTNEALEHAGWLQILKDEHQITLVKESNCTSSQNRIIKLSKRILKQNINASYNFKIYKFTEKQ